MSALISIAPRIIGGTVMLAAGCAFSYYSVPKLRKNYRRATKGVTTRGTIIGLETFRRIGGRTIYFPQTYYLPKVEFETPNGQKILFVPSKAQSAKPKIGRSVKVAYYPNNPHDADIVSMFRTWLSPLFFLAFAIVFLFASLEFYTAFFGASV